MMIESGLVIAVLKRAEQSAKDRASKLEADPKLKSAAHAERAAQGALARVRITIEDYVAHQQPVTDLGDKTG